MPARSIVSAGSGAEPLVPSVKPRVAAAQGAVEPLASRLEDREAGKIGNGRQVASKELLVADRRLKRIENLGDIPINPLGGVWGGTGLLWR